MSQVCLSSDSFFIPPVCAPIFVCQGRGAAGGWPEAKSPGGGPGFSHPPFSLASRPVHRLFGPIAIRSDICTKLLVTFCECFRRPLIAGRVGMTVLFVQ